MPRNSWWLLTFAQYRYPKATVTSYLELCLESTEYVVGRDTHDVHAACGIPMTKHLTLEDLRVNWETFCPECGINIEKIKTHKERVVAYVTKSDLLPIVENVPLKWLHCRTQVYNCFQYCADYNLPVMYHPLAFQSVIIRRYLQDCMERGDQYFNVWRAFEEERDLNGGRAPGDPETPRIASAPDTPTSPFPEVTTWSPLPARNVTWADIEDREWWHSPVLSPNASEEDIIVNDVDGSTRSSL